MNELQKFILDVYQQIANICDANDIPYYAIGGTCLGAVCYKGFIPWDDDLDIGIPIEDFERFRHAMRLELDSKYKLYTGENIRTHPTIFDKVVNTDTTFIQSSQRNNKDCYRGVYVDVFQICGLPKSTLSRKTFLLKIKVYTFLNFYKRYSDKNIIVEGRFIFMKKILKLLLRHMFSNDYFYKKSYDLMKNKYFKNVDKDGYIWSFSLKNRVFKKQHFEKSILVPFEHISMPIPSMYDEYLTVLYGDYRTPLPKEKRRCPHFGFVDLNKPFAYYQEHPEIVQNVIINNAKLYC